MCMFLLDSFLIANEFLQLEGFMDLFEHRLTLVYFQLTAFYMDVNTALLFSIHCFANPIML